MDTNDKRKMLAQAILSIESEEECFELLEDCLLYTSPVALKSDNWLKPFKKEAKVPRS